MTSKEEARVRSPRKFDIAVFGASGFTGELTASYLAEQLPGDAKWAIAGRNLDKLDRVRKRIGRPDLPIFLADSADGAALRHLASATRVLITTVGPYLRYGEPLVKACAEAGTDYLDLTGEPEFVDRMYVKYHAVAAANGARLIHCAGFDSIPHDLGVYFTVKHLPDGVPLTVDGVVRASGTISAGTYHSAITAFSRLREMRDAALERRKVEPSSPDRRASARLAAPCREGGLWLVPFPSIDPQVITRSARALPGYGPHFTYRHWIGVRRLPVAVGLIAGAAGLLAGAQVKPIRDLLLKLRDPGDGPDAATRARSHFTVRFTGVGGGRTVVTHVAGGDPGYGETAKMLAEAAMCLAYDDLPETAGQVTTAVARWATRSSSDCARPASPSTCSPAASGGTQALGAPRVERVSWSPAESCRCAGWSP